MIKALSCIVCDKELEGCATPNQPLDGVSFSTRGAYGTTVFDPMDGSMLEVNVCDPCLKAAGRKGQVLLYQPHAYYPAAAPTPWPKKEGE